MDYFDAASAEVGWQEGSADVMEGVYVAPETGYMLIVNPARDTYRYYEDLTAAKLVPTEEGTFTTDSSGLYGTCDKQTRAGDTFEGVVEFGDIPGVAGYVHPRAAVRITPGGPQCGPVVALTDATTEQTLWVRLFQYGTAAPFRE